MKILSRRFTHHHLIFLDQYWFVPELILYIRISPCSNHYPYQIIIAKTRGHMEGRSTVVVLNIYGQVRF
jgi:hypothetical protein